MSKPKKGKVSEVKNPNELSHFEELVLAAIKTEVHKPRAIVRICKNQVDQNQVVQILNKLKEKGLVKKVSVKGWIAA